MEQLTRFTWWRQPDSISSFKSRLDKYWTNQDVIYNYDCDLTGTGGLPVSMWYIVVWDAGKEDLPVPVISHWIGLDFWRRAWPHDVMTWPIFVQLRLFLGEDFIFVLISRSRIFLTVHLFPFHSFVHDIQRGTIW